MATCGSLTTGGNTTTGCYVKNDSPQPFHGTVVVSSLDYGSGNETIVTSLPVDMPAGAGQTQYFRIAGIANGTAAMLHTVVRDRAGVEVNSNYIPMAEPHRFVLPRADVKFVVQDAANSDGSIDIVVSTDRVAVYVTFTTLAQGRFSENVFVMAAGSKTVQFLPAHLPRVGW
jgi:uncharacterized protein YraI